MPATVALPGRRRAKVWTAVNPAAPLGGTYNDSGSGTIGLSFTPVGGAYGDDSYGDGGYGDSGVWPESHSRVMSATGTVPITGTRTESHSHTVATATAAGTIPLSGSATEEHIPPGGPGATRSRRPQQGFGK